AFFAEVAKLSPSRPGETLYVGDRLDNDVRPAAGSGFATALLRRGPWGTIQQHDPDAARVPTLRIDSLAELPALVDALNSGSR
ncbi:MAG TPA: HAD hydrolase-like protein, partial [Pseudonocardia sp.]|nr:HAD hydrolase-like protein [Pseudonocardia sp.]